MSCRCLECRRAETVERLKAEIAEHRRAADSLQRTLCYVQSDRAAEAELDKWRCPGCDGAPASIDELDVATCDACGGIYTGPADLHPDCLSRYLSTEWVAREPEAVRYFDLTTAQVRRHGEPGFQPRRRLHGWQDPVSLRVAQWG